MNLLVVDGRPFVLVVVIVGRGMVKVFDDAVVVAALVVLVVVDIVVAVERSGFVVGLATHIYRTSIATYLTTPHFARSGPFVTSMRQIRLSLHDVRTYDVTSFLH